MGTTIFAGSSRRSAPVDRNNWAPRFGFAYQLTPNTVLRGGAGLLYGMNVATNFQYAGTAFRKSALIKFTKNNYQSQNATFADPFPACTVVELVLKCGSRPLLTISRISSDLESSGYPLIIIPGSLVPSIIMMHLIPYSVTKVCTLLSKSDPAWSTLCPS